jgi:CPA2 family monovalent cation:H+ antiporter-2
MHEFGMLGDLVVVFGFAAAVVYVFHRLNQSPIVGFMITGTLIGPYGFSLVHDLDSIHTLATVGLMILLFSLGLEYSLKKLMETRIAVLLTGPLQTLGTGLVVTLIARQAGASLQAGIVYGMLVALSSTAIFMKMLSDRGEIDSVHARIGLGIAIFQDLATIPFMVAIPLMASEEASFSSVGLSVGKAALLIVGVLVVARYVFPLILRNILKTQSKELFLITATFLFLGTAWVSAAAGISLALGSFLAGLVLSESDCGQHIFAEVRPFRDGLNSLFFISLGMLVDPSFIAHNVGSVLLITAAVIFGKTLITTAAVAASRIPLHPALFAGTALAQIGEFSFVLLQAAVAAGIVGAGPYQILLACSVLSMIASPLFFRLTRNLVMRFARDWDPGLRIGRAENKEQEVERLGDHVIICGNGLGEQNIARALKANGIPYIIVDLNEQGVREARREGESILFGDCTNAHTLELAGIRRSRVIVFVVSDPFAARLGIKLAREMMPEIVVLARTKYVADMDALWDQGSTEVIAEEFEASLELMTRILRVYNAPRSMVAAEIKSIRDQRFGFFRDRKITVPRIRLSNELDIYTETWQAPAQWGWNDARVSEIGLREKTGSLILGIIRKNLTLNNPDPNMKLAGGDRLVLSGTKDQLKGAITLLSHETAAPEG